MTAVRHGLASVDDEVHQDLVEHPGIRAGHQRPRVQRQLHAHVLADDALEHLGEAGDNVVEIQRAAAQ